MLRCRDILFTYAPTPSSWSGGPNSLGKLEATDVGPLQSVRKVETWISNLIAAPVPEPGRTKVEVELLPQARPAANGGDNGANRYGH